MKIQFHWQLDVYKLSVEAGMEIFELSKVFPKEETYSLTNQIRRSSAQFRLKSLKDGEEENTGMRLLIN